MPSPIIPHRQAEELQTVRWTDSWLNFQAHAVISGMKSNWRLATSDVHQGLILGLMLVIVFSSGLNDGAEWAPPSGSLQMI